MSDLEDSIKELSIALTGGERWIGYKDNQRFKDALRAFADAISAKASEVQGEKEQFYCRGCEHFHKKGLKKEFGKQSITGANCNHCGGPIMLANPQGFCNHVYYPDNCDVCSGKQPTTEPKECLCKCVPHCDPCVCEGCQKQPTPELPAEVQRKVKEAVMSITTDTLTPYGIEVRLMDLANLCLSMRAK